MVYKENYCLFNYKCACILVYMHTFYGSDGGTSRSAKTQQQNKIPDWEASRPAVPTSEASPYHAGF